MAKKLKDTDYLYITAYLRAKENGLVDRDRTDRMINARSAGDAAKVLEECGYGEMSDITVSKLNERITEKRAAVMKDLESVVPDNSILDIFRIKYDYHNAKTLIKSEAMGLDAEKLLVDAGRYPAEKLAASYRREDLSDCSDTFAASVAEAKETLARTGDPQLADFILDNAYFKEYISLAEKTGSGFLTGYGRLMIDGANLRAAVRAKRMNKDVRFLERIIADGGNIPARDILENAADQKPVSSAFSNSDYRAVAELADDVAEGGSFTDFEKRCDDVLQRYLAAAKRISFGPEVLTAYICSVENELSAVRVIITGKLAGLTGGEIRERLGI